MEQKYVKICGRGHEIVFTKHCPLRCPVCGILVSDNVQKRVYHDLNNVNEDRKQEIDEKKNQEFWVELDNGDSLPESSAQISEDFVLNYFGELFYIPLNGTWIGRNALGAKILESNLLVSREHLYLRPDKLLGLSIKDVKSKNGTFIDTGNGKQPIEHGKEYFLRPGDKVWIYNVPFIVEVR